MGLLDLMLGVSGEGQQGVEGHSYKLPEETHEFVHPVAVRREELEAITELLETDAEVPSSQENPEELQAAFDEVFDGEAPDAATLVERAQESRHTVESVLETWREQVPTGIGVVYVQPDSYPAIVSFVKRCRRRDERDEDAFELPESFSAVPPLLARLNEATEDQYRAVVHTDLLSES